MIPAFNAGRYLAKTLECVLAQDPGPAEMQITVVDDHSTTDDPAATIASLNASERVSLFRQSRNVGHVRNFNTCIELARGELVHLLHGDDKVRPGFYRTMQRPFEQHPELGAAFCQYVAIDAGDVVHAVGPEIRSRSGILDGWLEQIAAGQLLQTPSIVVRRSVYEQLGGFDDRIRYYGEDWEMWVRIAASFPVWYENQPLALYRTHPESLSGRSARSGDNVRDLMTAIEINSRVLPADRAAEITKLARRYNAQGTMRRMMRAVRRDPAFPLAQLRATLQMHTDAAMLAKSAHLALQWMAFRILPSQGRDT